MALINILVHPDALVSRTDAIGLAQWLAQCTPLPVALPALPERIPAPELAARLSPQLTVAPDRRTLWSWESDHAPVECPAPVATVRQAHTPTVAANIIVRDGLSRGSDIVRAIRSVAPLCSEIVVHEGGSTDGTVDALRGLAELLPVARYAVRTDLPWVDDYAHARNRAMIDTYADYIVWIDDDEEWCTEAPAQVVAALHWDQAHDTAPCSYQLGRIGPGFERPIWRTFVFPRFGGAIWTNALHENIESSLADIGIVKTHLTAPIWHHSFADLEHCAEDSRRDARILRAHPELETLGWKGGTGGIWIVAIDHTGNIEIIEAPPEAATGAPAVMAAPHNIESHVAHTRRILDALDLHLPDPVAPQEATILDFAFDEQE